MLRLKVENKKCVSELSLKFGASLQEVPELLQTAKDLDLNIVGVRYVSTRGLAENAILLSPDWLMNYFLHKVILN